MENVLSGPPLQPNFWNGLDQNIGKYVLEYIRNNEDRVYMVRPNSYLKFNHVFHMVRVINSYRYCQCHEYSLLDNI